MKRIFITLFTLTSPLQFVLAQATRAEIDKMIKQAQEVEKVLPQAVQKDADGYKAIDYARLVPLLVEGN